MATDDQQRLVVGTASAPATFTVPGNGQIRPKAIFAHYDGSGAGGSYVPALKVTSDAGKLVGIYPVGSTTAAGVSADVSWFPRVAQAAAAASTGIQYDVNNVGDWLNVDTNGAVNKGMTFTVDDAGGYTLTDNGGGGISLRETSNGGIALTDDGTHGISLAETATGRIVLQAAATSAGTQINDASTNGIGVQATGSGGITIQSTGTGGIFVIGSAAGGVFLIGLPVVNPGGVGRLWNNGGVVNIT